MTSLNTSNVQSAVADLAPGLDLASALTASSVAPPSVIGAALANAGKRKGKGKVAPPVTLPVVPVVTAAPEPEATILPQAGTMATVGPVKVPDGAPATINLPADQIVIAGVTALADAMTAAIYASSNTFIALASFGEASGLAGKREAAEACLRVIANDPDRFIPAGASPNVKARIVRLCDKGSAGSEFSRAVSAITAGSVLLHYLTKARELFDANPNATGWSRVVQRLVSATLADARTALGKPVDATWAGVGDAVSLPTILAAAADTEKKAQAGTNAARNAGATVTTGNAIGSAGRTSNGSGNPALAPATAQAGVPNVPTVVPPVVPTDNVKGPAVPPAPPPPVTGPVVKPHVGKLQSITSVALSIQGDAPDQIRKDVIDQVDLIVRAVDAIRSLFNSASQQPLTANPAKGLAIMEGFDGFKIG